jgi:hypothetical protein
LIRLPLGTSARQLICPRGSAVIAVSVALSLLFPKKIPAIERA